MRDTKFKNFIKNIFQNHENETQQTKLAENITNNKIIHNILTWYQRQNHTKLSLSITYDD